MNIRESIHFLGVAADVWASYQRAARDARNDLKATRPAGRAIASRIYLTVKSYRDWGAGFR